MQSIHIFFEDSSTFLCEMQFFFCKRFCFLFTYSLLFILLFEIQFLIAFQQNCCITYRYGSSISNPKQPFPFYYFITWKTFPVEAMVNHSFYEVLQNGDRKWLVAYADVALNGVQRVLHISSRRTPYTPCSSWCRLYE